MQLFTRYEEIEPYITKDSSIIRELMHPLVHGNSNQSLAEATVPAGEKTLLHKHHLTEEIYHITEGSGIMTLGSEEFEVKKGYTVCISPGTPHRNSLIPTIPYPHANKPAHSSRESSAVYFLCFEKAIKSGF